MSNKKLKVGNVPNLRFPGFDGEWEVKKLGDLLQFKNGINASKEQYGKGIKFINVLDILKNDFITYENIVGKVDVASHIIDKFSVEFGDVLFQRSSETREDVGTANVYLDRENIATFGGFVIRGKKIGIYNPIFVNKLLKTSSARDSITSKSGGSTRFNVGQEILSSVALHFPCVHEQDKIADFLFIIDERIQTQNKIIRELNVLKNILIKKIFTQELRFKDCNRSEYPQWQTTTLGSICDINPKNNSLPDSFIYIDLESVANGKLLKEDYILKIEAPSRAQRLLVKKDVLFQMVRPYQKNNLYFNQDGNYVASTGYAQLRAKEDSKFLFQYIHFQEFVDKVIERCTGTSYPAINSKDLSGILVSIPYPDEQFQIGKFLSSIDSKIEIENELLQKLEKQKTFLLQNLFI